MNIMQSHLKSKRLKIVQKIYETGESIQPGGKKYVILALVERGRRSSVYKIEDKDGHVFALKVAIDNRPVTLSSIQKEQLKAKLLLKHDFSHASVIDSGENYVLKKWIEGMRGKEWVRQWFKRGRPPDSFPLRKLKKFIQSLADRKIYIRDLNPSNLIWDGKEWVIIDWGNVKKKTSVWRVLKLYRENVPADWGKLTSPGCEELFRKLIFNGLINSKISPAEKF